MSASGSLKYYYKQKGKALEYLGGSCVVCGTTEYLEFDHIEPELKSFTIGRKLSNTTFEDLIPELDKCQLLCKVHHKEKHAPQHGTISGYRHLRCRCDACRTAWNTKCKEWKRSRLV